MKKTGNRNNGLRFLIQQLDSHAPKKVNNETEINETEDGNDFPF